MQPRPLQIFLSAGAGVGKTFLIRATTEYLKRIFRFFLIKGSANTDTATLSDEFVKVYLNNYLAGQENEACIGKLESEVAVIGAHNSNKGIETNTCSISIPCISQTDNQSAKLKLFLGPRVMLTDNICVSDIN